MAVLLHNLLARSPKLQDLSAVTELLIACDIAEDGLSDYSEKDLFADWHRAGFNLQHDAWIITTKSGQVVGYADIWVCEHFQIEMRVRVHPRYRGRGIGTLLLRLAEEQARQHTRKADPGMRVTLQCAVSNANQVAKQLLEHEGYTLVHHFWRMGVDAGEPLDSSGGSSRLKFDLYLNTSELMGLASLQQRTGIYTASRYDVYEKELRAGEPVHAMNELCSIM